MGARELMLGNLVMYNGEIVEFDSHKAWHIHKLKPIPINAEWLVKFGFEAQIIIYSKRENSSLAVKLWNEESTPNIKYILFWENNVIRELEVFYVHQLQNLYYALTGQELQLNQTQ